MPDQPSPRRRFQFRLRTLLLAVAIVAVQCSVCLPMLREWRSQRETQCAELRRRIMRECKLVCRGKEYRVMASEIGSLNREELQEIDGELRPLLGHGQLKAILGQP
jgi:hypothetical protein